MDLYIYIDVKNNSVNDDQVWSDNQCYAVYRALCQFEGKNINQSNPEIDNFLKQQCKGTSFSISHEYHSSDKRTLNEVTDEASNLCQLLEDECADVGLVVSMSSSV